MITNQITQVMAKLSDLVLAGVADDQREAAWTAAVDAWWTDKVPMQRHIQTFMPPFGWANVIIDADTDTFYITATPPATCTRQPTPQGIMSVVEFPDPTKFFVLSRCTLRTKEGMDGIDNIIPLLVAAAKKQQPCDR